MTHEQAVRSVTDTLSRFTDGVGKDLPNHVLAGLKEISSQVRFIKEPALP